MRRSQLHKAAESDAGTTLRMEWHDPVTIKHDSTEFLNTVREAKAACDGAVLLFRMGDFYEAFDADAVTVSKTLGLTLTSRSKDSHSLKMAGFPYHQLDAYIGKLVASGFRVAVCERAAETGKLTTPVISTEQEQGGH
jgi:DNA mismatch repair ATPase MutS